jgi:hypothetical protein
MKPALFALAVLAGCGNPPAPAHVRTAQFIKACERLDNQSLREVCIVDVAKATKP